MANETIQIVEAVTVIELPRRPRPAGLFDDYCQHEGCKEWGSFGYQAHMALRPRYELEIAAGRERRG